MVVMKNCSKLSTGHLREKVIWKERTEFRTSPSSMTDTSKHTLPVSMVMASSLSTVKPVHKGNKIIS